MLVVQFMPEVVIGIVFTFYEGPVNVSTWNVIMTVHKNVFIYAKSDSYCKLNHVWLKWKYSMVSLVSQIHREAAMLQGYAYY